MMMPTQKGSFRLFQFAGISVFLHWSWFLVAVYEISDSGTRYSSLAWNVAEYLALFGIVLMHEFGHSLACRSVGGKAEQIVLWPLGGVAYVDPPQRPGATLWSIAAGPLVNVVLFVVLTGVGMLGRNLHLWEPQSDIRIWLRSLWIINTVLLVFNLLPVYPLDGGQILRSLLWFVFGRTKSLLVSSVIGMIGVVGLIALAVLMKSVWFGIMSGFILMNCWRGLQQARMLAKIEQMPRRSGAACPGCKEAPLRGAVWKCNQCGTEFDTFETNATCPKCACVFELTRCTHCGDLNPLSAWLIPPPIEVTVIPDEPAASS